MAFVGARPFDDFPPIFDREPLEPSRDASAKEYSRTRGDSPLLQKDWPPQAQETAQIGK
jgi:hypothetical protein